MCIRDRAKAWAPGGGKYTCLDYADKFAFEAMKLSRRSFLVADEVGSNFGHYPTAHKGMPRFREWLKTEYNGDIIALNRSWGTAFKAFEEVPPVNLWLQTQGKSIDFWNDVWGLKDKQRYANFDAVPANHPGRALAELKKIKREWWFDLTRYSKVNSIDFIRRIVERIRKTAPHVLGGTQYLGLWDNDAEYYAQNLGFATMHTPLDESGVVMRDIAGPGAIVGGYTGGYLSQRSFLRRLVWFNLLQGYNNLSYFCHYGAEGMISADGSLTPYWQALSADMGAIAHEGLGKWVKHARRLDSGVAMLYDFRSVLANEWARTFGESQSSFRVMAALCLDAGMPIHAVGGREVEDGILARENFRAILLPCAVAVSAKQVQALKAFVEQGGLLIADAACGVFDGHGKEIPGGMLAEVLGVRQNLKSDPAAKPDAWQKHLRVAGKPELAPDSSLPELPFGVANPAVEAITAKAYGKIGDTPVWFVNRLGQGQAFLLNFAPYAYDDLRESQEVPDGCLKAWSALLGVPALFSFEDKDGKALGNLDTANIFEIDGKRLFGLLPGRSFPVEVGARLKLDRKWHVYDFFQKKYLGKSDTVPLGEIRKHVPVILGLLPYKVESIAAAFSAAPARGQTVQLSIRVNTDGPVPGRHLLWVRLVDPAGADCRWHEERPFAEQGACAIHFAFAMNEKPGRYTLTVTDVISQVASRLEFDIQE